MSSFTIIPAGARTWVLRDDGQPVGSLRLARTATTMGEILDANATWPISRVTGRWYDVALGDRAHPLVRFGDELATVTGKAQPVPWELRGRAIRFHMLLGGGAESLEISTSGWLAPSAEVTVRGGWERRDLLILACFFVVLSRRRRTILLIST